MNLAARTGGWWLGFDVGGTRTKAGVVGDDGAVERTHVEDTGREPFDVVWQRMLAFAESLKP